MLTSVFETEQPVNSLFFMHVWMLSLRVYFKLLAHFDIGGKGQIVFVLPPTSGRGRETEAERRHLPEFSEVFFEARSSSWGGCTHSSTAEYSPAQSCIVWVQLGKS